LRADARRNRDAILRASREVFEVDGIFAPIDGIATAAGVGNATLHRNFPTRDDLLAAVIEDSVRELVQSAALAASGAPPASRTRARTPAKAAARRRTPASVNGRSARA
jgi:AcrR family transcriptional regulator